MDKPAFPRNYAYMNPEAGKSELRSVEGMTLREYYAGKAMEALLSNPIVDHAKATYQDVAKKALKYSDALIAELEKQS